MSARQTKQREVILQLLRATNIHPSADEIYQQVRGKILNISKGTVYRNLKVLQGMGLVSGLDFEGISVRRFDANQDIHYHFKCEICGRVFDINIPALIEEKLAQHIVLNTGHKVLHHHFEFHGICYACKESTVIQVDDTSQNMR